jgi:hypothetical protein
MCGRARLSSEVSEIKIRFAFSAGRRTPNFAPIWKVAPTDPLPVVGFNAKAQERGLDVMRWGVVPFWAKDVKVRFRQHRRQGRAHRDEARLPRGVPAAALPLPNGKRPRRESSPTRSRSPTGKSWRWRRRRERRRQALATLSAGMVVPLQSPQPARRSGRYLIRRAIECATTYDQLRGGVMPAGANRPRRFPLHLHSLAHLERPSLISTFDPEHQPDRKAAANAASKK